MNLHELRKAEKEHERVLREIDAMSDHHCHVVARYAKRGGSLPSSTRRELRDAANSLMKSIRAVIKAEAPE